MIKRIKSYKKLALAIRKKLHHNQLGIIIIPCHFSKQKGIYKVIKKNRFIFIKGDLCPELRDIVLLHEIGHDVLHRKEAETFQEFNISEVRISRMEMEANRFAAEVSLPDEDVLEYIYQGLNMEAIAERMNSNVNLVALKIENLKWRVTLLESQVGRQIFLDK